MEHTSAHKPVPYFQSTTLVRSHRHTQLDNPTYKPLLADFNFTVNVHMFMCVYPSSFSGRASQSQMMCPSPPSPPFAHSTCFFPFTAGPRLLMLPSHPATSPNRPNTGMEKAVHIAQTYSSVVHEFLTSFMRATCLKSIRGYRTN
jgi:hypothetical protein